MAVEQLDLLGGARPLSRPAHRQDAVIALLHAHPEGCTADEIGAAIHASSGRHPADSVCQYCGVDARPVTRALERKKLVVRTGSGLFTLRNIGAVSGGPGELPEGF